MGQKITKTEKARFIFLEIGKIYPHAKCELVHQTALELMVAIILSAQTTDQSVNRLTQILFQKYRSLDDYIQVPLSELEHDLRHLGLYKNKAKNIQGMATLVQSSYHGEFPADQELLESLPGVGRKTANVFLAEWYHIPRIAVDTHVKRVSSRLGLANSNDTPEKVEKKLMQLYPESDWIQLHHRLIFFGRYFCKAVKPQCKECPLLSVCLKPVL